MEITPFFLKHGEMGVMALIVLVDDIMSLVGMSKKLGTSVTPLLQNLRLNPMGNFVTFSDIPSLAHLCRSINKPWIYQRRLGSWPANLRELRLIQMGSWEGSQLFSETCRDVDHLNHTRPDTGSAVSLPSQFMHESTYKLFIKF